MLTHKLHFAALLAQLRREKQLSQGQLARLARCTRPYIGQLERGERRRLSERLAQQMAGALQLQGQQRQDFLTAAGWPPALPEVSLGILPPLHHQYAQSLVDGSLYPGVLHDSQWTVQHANALACALFGQLGEPLLIGESLLAQVFSLHNRAHVPNWEVWARSMLAQFKRDSAHLVGAAQRQQLLLRLRSLPDFSRLWTHVESAGDTTPTMPIEFMLPEYGLFRLEVIRLQFVGLPELWHVAFLPASDGARQLLRTIALPGR